MLSVVNELLQWTVLILLVMLGVALAGEMRARRVNTTQGPSAVISLKAGDLVDAPKVASLQSGELWSNRSASHNQSLLLFVSPSCGACVDLLESLDQRLKSTDLRVPINIVSVFSDGYDIHEFFSRYGSLLSKVWVDVPDGNVAKDFGVNGTPCFVRFDESSGKVLNAGLPVPGVEGWPLTSQ